MKKNLSILLLLFLTTILLIGCGNQTEATETLVEEPVIQTTDTPVPVPTETTEPAKEPTSTEMPEVEPTEIPEEPTEIENELPIETPTEQTSLLDEVSRMWDTDQMMQVFVPAGDFIMGSDAPEAKTKIEGGRAYPEIPVHTVYLDGYWIDKYEVSNAQYALCVEAGVCIPPYLVSSETRPHYYDDPAYADYPVIWVKWAMAKTYCDWAGRRLPTEAEWEKAARGTEGAKYPWGNDPVTGEHANFCDTNCERTISNYLFDDGYADTAPVGSYPAGISPYGAMDMSGNVWEWTISLIVDYPYDPDDGREDPDANGERVWRGGPWSNGYWWMRSAVRYRSIPDYWYVNLGFRCAATE